MCVMFALRGHGTAQLPWRDTCMMTCPGYLKIEDMVKKGIWMNIISILLLTVIVYYSNR